jgi:hypothetical protein
MTDDKELEDKAICLSAINTMSDDSTSLNSDDSKRNTLLEVVKANETLFGRDITTKQPISVGNVFAFLYINNNPTLIVGPHCIYQ